MRSAPFFVENTKALIKPRKANHWLKDLSGKRVLVDGQYVYNPKYTKPCILTKLFHVENVSASKVILSHVLMTSFAIVRNLTRAACSVKNSLLLCSPIEQMCKHLLKCSPTMHQPQAPFTKKLVHGAHKTYADLEAD